MVAGPGAVVVVGATWCGLVVGTLLLGRLRSGTVTAAADEPAMVGGSAGSGRATFLVVVPEVPDELPGIAAGKT